MSALSELQMRILSELEELQYENVPAMMNTVTQPTGDAGELAEMQGALEDLVLADFVTMCMNRDPSNRLKRLSKDESLDVIADLKAGLRFNSDKMRWTDTRRSGPPNNEAFPYIVNTESGKEKGFEILEKRGYQWWRPKK